MHLFHIPQCSIQNRNVHIFVLNGALWDMEQVYSGIREIGQFRLAAPRISPLWVSSGISVVLREKRCIDTELLYKANTKMEYLIEFNHSNGGGSLISLKHFIDFCLYPPARLSGRRLFQSYPFRPRPFDWWQRWRPCHANCPTFDCEMGILPSRLICPRTSTWDVRTRKSTVKPQI